MEENKETEKKDAKVEDLAPKKDAKGGTGANLDRASVDRGRINVNRGGQNLDRGGQNLDRGGNNLS